MAEVKKIKFFHPYERWRKEKDKGLQKSFEDWISEPEQHDTIMEYKHTLLDKGFTTKNHTLVNTILADVYGIGADEIKPNTFKAIISGLEEDDINDPQRS